MEPTLDADVIEQCRKQDLEAFGKVVDAYQNRVFGFVRRFVKDPDEAADVAQEVFIKAYQSFGRFDGRAPIRTWLFRIAYNLCVDRSRKVARSPEELRIDAGYDDDEPIEISDSKWSPEQLTLTQELREMIEKALSEMSDKLRSVLLLHDREDMPYEEIARTLDIPIGTVKSRLFLARAHLQKALTPYLSEPR